MFFEKYKSALSASEDSIYLIKLLVKQFYHIYLPNFVYLSIVLGFNDVNNKRERSHLLRLVVNIKYKYKPYLFVIND